MKYLILFTFLASLSMAKTIKEGDTEYSCNPVKTCDEKLKQAYAEIARLKKQVKVVTKTVEVEKIVEKTEIKKHIISLVTGKTITVDAEVTSGSTAKAISSTKIIPVITYQYQFDNGLVPLIGLDIFKDPKLMFGLGYEF